MRPGVFPASKASPCPVCGQQVQPGDMIIKIAGRTMLPLKDGGGLVYMPGSYAHEECVWPGAPTSAPYLTWEQMDAVNLIVTTIQLPKGELRTRKLLGAIRVAWFNRHHNPKWQKTDAALSLGQDMLDGYRFILKLADKEGPWFEPVGYDGKPWIGVYKPVEPERIIREAEEMERTSKRVKVQDVHPLVKRYEELGELDDGFWVRGPLITPVKYCLMTYTSVYIRPVDRPGLENWMVVPNYQLAGSKAEAIADVEQWEMRMGPAAGAR